MGTAGGLRGDTRRLEWKYVDWNALPARTVDAEPTPDRGYNRETLPWTDEHWEGPDDMPGAQTRFYEDLFRTIRYNAPLVITPNSVRRRIAVMDQARRYAAGATIG
jgi:hypothetical protein